MTAPPAGTHPGPPRVVFDVTVEIPTGTRNEYTMDRRTGRIRFDRTLFTATQYPADHGFVEHTTAGNAGPLGALVLVREPTFPGCLIRCRAIGMFRMRDERGPDPKILCIPTADPRLVHLCDVADLEPFYRLEIQHFFEVYQDLEPGKSVDVERGAWAGRAEAEAEIERSTERFWASHGGRRRGGGAASGRTSRSGWSGSRRYRAGGRSVE